MKRRVLRVIYIDPDVDDELRNQAFSGRESKNDLIRKYLRIGMTAPAAMREAADCLGWHAVHPSADDRIGFQQKQAANLARRLRALADGRKSS